MLIIALDWRIWQPARRAKALAFERWLAMDVLQNSEPPQENWKQLNGRFRGREVTVSRAMIRGMRAMEWTAKTVSSFDLRVVRLEMPRPPETLENNKAAQEYSSGDEDFESLYAWQTHKPLEVLPVLKDARARGAIKRLASLYAQRGNVSDPELGINIAAGSISVLQTPAPDLLSGSYSPEEALLVLSDLATLADCLEGKPGPSVETAPKVQESAGDPLSAWLGVGCFGMLAIVSWMGATWAVAHYLGLAPAMVVFFIPAVLLAFLFLLGNAGSSGRPAEIEEVIQKQASDMLAQNEEMKALRAKLPA